MNFEQLSRAGNLDFQGSQDFVKAKLGCLTTPEKLLTFLSHYTSKAHVSGAGAATLVAKISRTKNIFVDREELIPAFADRATHLASYVFDVLPSEYNDDDFTQRSTRRDLSHSMLRGVLQFLDHVHHDVKLKERAVEVLAEPEWLSKIKLAMIKNHGYGSADTMKNVFKCLGFYLGSRLHSGFDITAIDQHLQKNHPDMVEYLKAFQFKSGQDSFPAYAWLQSHSNASGAKGCEAAHATSALNGINYGLALLNKDDADVAHDCAIAGYKSFLKLRQSFFNLACGKD